MIDAFNLGSVDDELLQALVAHDIELYDFPEAPGRHRYTGHDGIRQFVADFAENWKSVELEVADVREIGDRIVVLGHQRTVGALTDVPVETDFGDVFDFDGERIAALRIFRDHDRALEAAGA